jgi:hypothetical protein
MGILKINNKDVKLGQIKVYSWLSEIRIKPEFTFSINVYNPDEENSPLVISYDHISKDGISNIEDLFIDKIEFSFSDLNKYGNLIYVDDEEFEAIDLSIQINSNPLSKNISGSGRLRNIESKETILLSFQGVIELTKTEYIKYDFLKYKFQRSSMIEVLESISNKKELIDYKKAVPYVHIPLEELSQWESAYGIDFKWFYDEYNEIEIQLLSKINEQITLLYKDFEGQIENFPDVPEILKNKRWRDLMIMCHNALKIIKCGE